jgi:hypothetical protein
MFNGLDGSYMRVLIATQWEWMPLSSALGMNIFQGLGNVFYGTTMNWIPTYLIQLAIGGEISPTLSYALFSVELYLAAYLWARLFCLSPLIAHASGWILCLLAFPFMYKPLLNAIYQLIPHLVDQLFISVLFLYALHAVDKDRWLKSTFAAMVVIVAPAYMLITNPLLSMIFVPAMAIGALAGCGKTRVE